MANGYIVDAATVEAIKVSTYNEDEQELTVELVEEMKVVKLKEALKQLGLSKNGNKADLK